MHEFDEICYGKTVEELQKEMLFQMHFGNCEMLTQYIMDCILPWNIRQVCIRNRNHSSGHHSYHGVIYKFEADVIKNRTSKNIL